MRQAKVFLLDVSAAGCVGSAVRPVLEAEAHLQLESCKISMLTPDELRTELSRSSASHTCDITLLCCGYDRLSEIIQTIKELHTPGCPWGNLVVATECAGPGLLEDLLRVGASEFLVPPFDSAHVLPRLWRALGRLEPEVASGITSHEELKAKAKFIGVVGESPALLAEVRKVSMIAQCDASALIAGESGTGKELFARAVHYLSRRAGKPFIPVNCGAIPFDLIENELFGHESGAYTGANTGSGGLIQEAEGGTLFLDEVDSLTLDAQVKLLRFLQEREYRRLGSRKTWRADVRLVAATNCPLEKSVLAGKFRQDLFYRLSVVGLRLPPLRERAGDISMLAHHFLQKHGADLNKPGVRLSPCALQRLIAYDWPGNVRELESVIMRSVLLAESSTLYAHDVALPQEHDGPVNSSFRELKANAVAQFEQRYLTEMLIAFGGNIAHAASAAKKHRRAFWQLMRKHDIRVSALLPGLQNQVHPRHFAPATP